MECWSNGVLEYWNTSLQDGHDEEIESTCYSITPLLHYSLKLLLRKVNYFVFIILISCSAAYAQFDNYSLDFKAVIKSNDGVQKLILFNRENTDDVIEGYFLITRGNHNIEGQIQKGGFNFLDPKVFELGLASLKRTWVKNNFPIKDIETMTNGVDVEKAYSFEITPEVLNIQSDTLSFYIRGVFYNLIKQNDKHSEFNLNYDVNLSYKLFKIPFNQSVPMDFVNEQLQDYNCSITFTKIKKSEEFLSISSNQPLFNGIKQSASESSLPPNVRFKISAEYLRTSADKKLYSIGFSPTDYLLRVQQHPLIPIDALVDKQFNNIASLPVDAYHAELTFPFKLYNKEKAELYKNYKTEKEIFRSKYNIVVVPIALNADTLTADVFLTYSKISLNDNIPRWTPVKKRLKLIQGSHIAIELPKENWSANFTREGEKYAIYGYSDFESYVNEYLFISFNSLQQINRE